MNELKLCVAAFFRSKGKTVVTEKEFLMGVSMNMRWMPYSDAEKVLSLIVNEKIVEKDGEYIRPMFDLNSVDVPIGYRPPSDLSSRSAQTTGRSLPPASPKTGSEDLFQTLLSKASAMGLDRKEFLSYCRTVQKNVNVDIEVAAIIVLRDNGADVSRYIEEVYELVSKR